MQEKTFQRRLAILKTYYKEKGSLKDIKSGDTIIYEGKEINLIGLINNLRKEYREKTIAEEYIKELESLGMVWKMRDKPSGTQQRLAPLIAYYHEFGDLSRIRMDERYVYQGHVVRIGALVSALRRQYLARSKQIKRVRPLTDEEVMLLEKMNFKWDQFYKNNQELIEQVKCYYKVKGSIANIKTDDTFVYNNKVINIGKIIISLRSKYTNKDNPEYVGKLTNEQIKELEMMGMNWNGNRNDPYRLDPLIDYYNKNGSLKGLIGKNLLYEYNGKQVNLNRLANNLRRQYILRERDPRDISSKERPLTDAEVKLLTKMEFPFFPIRDKIKTLIEVLEAYYKENGTIADIDSDTHYIYKGNKYNLEEVIVNLRRRYNEREAKKWNVTPLVNEEIQALEEIGMDWQGSTSMTYRSMHRKYSFIKWCKYLNYYYQNYGSLNKIKIADKIDVDGEIVEIGDIVRILRKRYLSRQNRIRGIVPLTDKEVAMLESMGMEWSVKHLSIARRKDLLSKYYENYGSLSQIKIDDKIEYEGKTINIGRTITELREYYQIYLKSGEYFKPEDIEQLNKMGMIWNKQPNRKK